VGGTKSVGNRKSQKNILDRSGFWVHEVLGLAEGIEKVTTGVDFSPGGGGGSKKNTWGALLRLEHWGWEMLEPGLAVASFQS